MMARFDLADESGSREVVAFSRAYESMADSLVDELPVVLIAEASLDDDEFRLVADRLIPWDEREHLPQVLLLDFGSGLVTREQLLDLRSQLDEHAGLTPVRFRVQEGDELVTFAPEGMSVAPAVLSELQESCPWLSPQLTLDREQLLRVRSGNGYAQAAQPVQASVDVPF